MKKKIISFIAFPLFVRRIPVSRSHCLWCLSFLLAVALASGAIAKGFLTAASYPTGGFPSAAVVQDFNNDGIADIATANLNGRNVSVLLGNADGTFGTAVTFSVGAAATEVASADVNGDGNADLVVTDGIRSAYIVLGNGDGTFGAPTSISLHVDPIGIEIADLNGDGKLDLAIAIFGPSDNSAGEVAIVLGNGDGSFREPVYYRLGHNANRLVVVDLNGDGKLDLAVAVQHFATVRGSLAVLLGNGDGTFQAPMLSVRGTAIDVAAGDLNADGKIDLILAGGFDGVVRTVLGNGDGTFQSAVTYDTTASAFTVALADLNGDRVPDIVIGGDDGSDVLLGEGDGTFGQLVAYGVGTQFAALGNFNNDQAPDIVAGGFDHIAVAFGNGDGTFRAPLVYSAGASIDGLASADFNGDGHVDVVIGRQPLGHTLSILLGDGQGKFTQGATFSDVTPRFVITGDFNGDMKPDISITSSDFGGVFVYLGNGDGTFQAGKKTSLPEPEWQASGDFNHDGHLDLAISHESIDVVSVLLGNGDGTFQAPVNYSTGDVPQSPLSVDFDADGNLDLAVANTFSNTVGVYLGNGDGTFRPALITAATGPTYMASDDFNRDGKPDLVVSGNGTKLLLGEGDGTFQAPRSLLATSGPVQASDVNGDGKLDVVVAGDFAELDVLRGRGDGTFRPAVGFVTGGIFTGPFILADLNGDALPEAIVSNINDAISVLLNTTRSPQALSVLVINGRD